MAAGIAEVPHEKERSRTRKPGFLHPVHSACCMQSPTSLSAFPGSSPTIGATPARRPPAAHQRCWRTCTPVSSRPLGAGAAASRLARALELLPLLLARQCFLRVMFLLLCCWRRPLLLRTRRGVCILPCFSFRSSRAGIGILSSVGACLSARLA